MATIPEVLEAEVMKLNLESRALLAQKLLESLDNPTQQENEQIWLAEAKRRHEELTSGKVTARNGEEVLDRIAADLQ